MPDASLPASDKTTSSGCGWLAWIFIIVVALGPTALQSLVATLGSDHHKAQNRRTRLTSKDLQASLLSYKTEYHHFPLSDTSASKSDLALRSRGPLLEALINDADGLNSKKIKFINLPMANDSKDGLWKDDAEWVLSDRWGEPFYIVLDTNGDGKIANPEYGADRSDPEYAKLETYPPPAELPLGVIVYSAGKDRDPKTWRDNICTWKSP